MTNTHAFPPVKGFIENSFIDWPGRIAAVVFLPGCNFRCPYCHNHILAHDPDQLPDIDVLQITQRIQALRTWVDGVVITGGEPTMSGGLEVLIRHFNQIRLPVKLDTNGSRPRILQRLLHAGLLEGIAMDVKDLLTAETYQRTAGTTVDLNAVTDSLNLLARAEIWTDVRMTVVPGWHSRESILKVAACIRRMGHRLRLQGYQPPSPIPDCLEGIAPFDTDLLRTLQAEIDGPESSPRFPFSMPKPVTDRKIMDLNID